LCGQLPPELQNWDCWLLALKDCPESGSCSWNPWSVVPSVAVVDCGVGLVHWGECLRMAAGRCSCSSLMVENGGNPRLGVPRKKYGAFVQLAVGFQLESVDGVQMQRLAALKPQPRQKNCP